MVGFLGFQLIGGCSKPVRMMPMACSHVVRPIASGEFIMSDASSLDAANNPAEVDVLTTVRATCPQFSVNFAPPEGVAPPRRGWSVVPVEAREVGDFDLHADITCNIYRLDHRERLSFSPGQVHFLRVVLGESDHLSCIPVHYLFNSCDGFVVVSFPTFRCTDGELRVPELWGHFRLNRGRLTADFSRLPTTMELNNPLREQVVPLVLEMVSLHGRQVVTGNADVQLRPWLRVDFRRHFQSEAACRQSLSSDGGIGGDASIEQ